MAYQASFHHPSAFESVVFSEGGAGLDAPCVFCITAAGHPFDAKALFTDATLTICFLYIGDWDNALTPWPAPGLYKGDAPFQGLADQTLAEVEESVIPYLQATHHLTTNRFALMGYSLGGLFSLYAFTKSSRFEAVAGMSSSVWYKGWISYMEGVTLSPKQKFAYLSLGSKEKRANPPILHCVQDNTERTAELLREKGVETRFELNPGNHYQQVDERIKKGFDALQNYFSA